MNIAHNMGNLPIKIQHAYKKDENATFEENCAYIDQGLDYLISLGFGGIVTNVSWSRDYLKSADDFALFRYCIKAAKKKGMHVWAYDEKGYPSGGAGGLTLEAHPEYEALALVKIANVLAPGKETEVKLPRGHEKFIYAASYKCDFDGNIKSFAPIDECFPKADEATLKFTNTSDSQSKLICAFAVKKAYEGTHSMHNCFDSRRYIDVSSVEAVTEFINNTYKPYFENIALAEAELGEKIVEAVFTDEPSYMACYINHNLFPQSVHDKYDTEIPYYPMINYGRDLENAFESLSGLPFKKNLIYLFYGKSDRAKKARYYYHLTLSKLYEKSFFENIGNLCSRHDIDFSGHILLEDDIRHHVIFEGNFFSLLRHMHTPGIDMLHSKPDIVRREMFTPKLMSSIAHGYNRPHVMSEVSAHAQGGNVTMDEMYSSLCLQYAFGVDRFTSYYSTTMAEPETYNKYNSAIGRIDAIMGGGNHNADVLLYYPIETFMMNRRPMSTNAFTEFTLEENACQKGLYSIMNELCDAQVDFDFCDLDLLRSLDIKGGRLQGRRGEDYKCLILPPMELTDEAAGLFSVLEKKGIKILLMRDGRFPDLSFAHFGQKFSTSAALVMSLDRFDDKYTLNLDHLHRGVVCYSADFAGKYKYMFTNSNYTDTSVDVQVRNIENPTIYCPMSDTYIDAEFKRNPFGFEVSFNLPAMETYIIMNK